MTRLPSVGNDKGTWGNILNDFLSQSHAADGTLNPEVVDTANIKQHAVTSLQLDKFGQAGGIAALDVDGDVVTASNKKALVAETLDNATAALLASSSSQTKTALSQTFTHRSELFVSVKQFGAKGDGATDDTASIQAAIDSLSTAGGSVYFPAGTYVLTSAIQARNALKLFGEGNSATVLYQTNTSAHGISGTDIISFSIEDLRISGPTTGTGIGIMMERLNANATNYISIKNVYVRTFGKDGIYVSNGIVSHFETVISETNGANGFNLVGLNGVIGTSTSLSNCFANANGLSGYRIDTMGYLSLNACAADNNAISYEVLDSIGLSFNGCGSEGALTAAWKISGGYGSTITSGWVYLNKGIGVHVTGSAIGITVIGISETSPDPSATAFIKVDAGSKASLLNIHNDTPNVLAGGTTQIFNDVTGNSSFNGSLNVDGPLTINGQAVRGSKWYLSNASHGDYTDITDMREGDIFMYGGSRDLFSYEGGTWVYSGALGA